MKQSLAKDSLSREKSQNSHEIRTNASSFYEIVNSNETARSVFTGNLWHPIPLSLSLSLSLSFL